MRVGSAWNTGGMLLTLWGCGGDATNAPARDQGPTPAQQPSSPSIGQQPPSPPLGEQPPVLAPAEPVLLEPSELFQIDQENPAPPQPVAGVCPAGSQPINPAACDVAKRGGGLQLPCLCSYECTPGCGVGALCAPGAGGNECRCHASLEGSPDDCRWTGLLRDGNLRDASDWRFWTQGEKDTVFSQLLDGHLELLALQRCKRAWAGVKVRLPPRAFFPEGAALVFRYRALGAQDPETRLGMELAGLRAGGLPFNDTPRIERRCVDLLEEPQFALLSFDLESYGVCVDPIDLSLEVYDLQLEAEPSCR
jgi:hypothetical protein